MTIRVLIADDHKLFRQGLISLMNTRKDLVEVVGEAENGEEAIRMAGELQPDVILMDIEMPKWSTDEIEELTGSLKRKIIIGMKRKIRANDVLSNIQKRLNISHEILTLRRITTINSFMFRYFNNQYADDNPEIKLYIKHFTEYYAKYFLTYIKIL